MIINLSTLQQKQKPKIVDFVTNIIIKLVYDLKKKLFFAMMMHFQTQLSLRADDAPKQKLHLSAYKIIRRVGG